MSREFTVTPPLPLYARDKLARRFPLGSSKRTSMSGLDWNLYSTVAPAGKLKMILCSVPAGTLNDWFLKGTGVGVGTVVGVGTGVGVGTVVGVETMLQAPGRDTRVRTIISPASRDGFNASCIVLWALLNWRVNVDLSLLCGLFVSGLGGSSGRTSRGFPDGADEAEGIFADLLVLQRVVPHDPAYLVPNILHSGSVLSLVDQELRNLVGAEGFSLGGYSDPFHFLTEVGGFLEVWSEFRQAVWDVGSLSGAIWVAVAVWDGSVLDIAVGDEWVLGVSVEDG